MKTKIILLCIAALVASCSDSNEKRLVADSIIGTWTMKSILYSECSGTADWIETFDCDVFCGKYIFAEGGEVTYKLYENGFIVGSGIGEYRIVDGDLIIDNRTYSLSIKSSTMTWVYQDVGCKTTSVLDKQ